MKLSSSFIALSLAGALIGLSACSGGGGGGSPSPVPTPSPTPTPTPTPTNSPPNGVIDTPDGTSADEGQMLRLDASASDDLDGDALTFSWTQTSGPTANIDDNSADIINVSLPEVSGDTQLTFEVTISDGVDQDMVSVTITALDIVLSPVASFLGNRVDQLTGLNAPRGLTVRVVAPLSSSDQVLSGFEDEASGLSFFEYRQSGSINFQGGQKYTLMGIPGENVIGAILDLQGFSFYRAAALEESDKVYALNTPSNGSSQADTRLDVDIEEPCALGQVYMFGETPIIVGKRMGLDVILPNSFSGMVNDADIEVLSSSGEFCAVAGYPNARIYALNSDDNSIQRWDWDDSVQSFNELGRWELNIPTTLSAHKMLYFQTNRVNLLALLFTDGAHDGDHRVVIVQETGAGVDIVERSWSKGVPSGLTLQQQEQIPGSDLVIDLFVSMATAPYIVALQGTNLTTNNEDHFNIGELEFAPYKLGASEITSFRREGLNALVLGFSEDGVIEVMERTE